ncbi:hypothetical protein [Psychromonas antarctica]|uniref:hypothetical protein n=1 Tax=Psychromonas antarctica TaxID=67573 RepID=UPI001EE84E6A|nr:hypothetical protein [Psychromonas antarctica]MCG6201688.1 hypothetical protein [Psychromonas antarctica]
MKRIITLILMFTILITFTQKVTVFAAQSKSEMSSMVNCAMSIDLNKFHMNKAPCSGNDMTHNMDCQNNCDFMTVVSVLYFIDYAYSVYQPQLQLAYQTGSAASPYYFPESLYRPPFLS